MNIHNLNSDLITNELLFKFNEYFKKYEVNYNNYITIDSLLIIINHFGYLPTQYEINDIKSEVGEKVDKIYFFVIMGRIVKKMYEHSNIVELKECFTTIDFDKNGTIEKEELFKMMKTYIKFPPSKDEIDSFFNEMDLNHNGRISFDQFLILLQPH